MKKTIYTLICLALICGGLGCAALSHYVTPADIDKDAVKYVEGAEIAEPGEYGGYPSLLKALRLAEDVDIAHTVIQFDLEKLVQKDNLNYSIHKNVVAANSTVALEREGQLFGPDGLLSMGLSMVGVGGFAGFLGLMRKRPGDVTPIEAEQAVAQATGRTTEELSIKEKQFIQLVKGVQAFLTTHGADRNIEKGLKDAMNKYQDTDTKVAVATVIKTA